MWLLTENLRLLFHFVVHILVGAIIFSVLAVAALALWELTEWMKNVHAPFELWIVCHGVADLLFFVDVICFVLFTLAEGLKLVREIWAGLRGSGGTHA